MIAGFLLILALVGPTGRIEAKAYQMPSYTLCEKAMKEFLAAPHKADEDEPVKANRRSAACLTVPATGRDT